MNSAGRGCPGRVVLTGGPGGGKTTAADLFRREIGDRVVIVPEAATMLFSGGFPRVLKARPKEATQRAIYHVQRSIEDVQAGLYPNRVLLCDRGTVDGAAYWPDGTDEYFASVGSSLEAELARYDAVLFFETAAVGNHRIEGGNRVRVENNEEAVALDRALRALWSKHPRYVLVPHEASFFQKLHVGLGQLHEILDEVARS
jgi:predicted ATPase